MFRDFFFARSFAKISAKRKKENENFNFSKFSFERRKKVHNLVELEKRCKMSIWSQKSASIQLRTAVERLGYRRIYRGEDRNRGGFASTTTRGLVVGLAAEVSVAAATRRE